MSESKQKKIVVIGGGTGIPLVIEGLLEYPVYPVSICTMFDSGGSSGQLRDMHGVLPPGDFRRAIVAHRTNNEETLRDLFTYRFPEDGSPLSGHVLGNLMTAACEKLWGRSEVVARLSNLFQIRGEVWPVSTDTAHLVAELSDGTIIQGETNIDRRAVDDDRSIERVWLSPKAFAHANAIDAIMGADMIVLGPGDLYTSIIPNLLVEGVVDAIREAPGKVVYVANIMTKHAETNGYGVAQFVETLCSYGIAAERLDAVLVNTGSVPEELAAHYRETERALPVALDADEPSLRQYATRIVRTDFLNEAGFATGLIRHDPHKLGRALMERLHDRTNADRLVIVDLDDTLVHTTRDMRTDGASLENLRLVAGAREFLERHSGSLVLLTLEKTPGLQRKKIDHLGIGKHFREIHVVSEREGKQTRLERLISESALPRESIVVIGDRVDSELAVAKNQGCKTVRVTLAEGKYASLDASYECDHAIPDFTRFLL